MSVFLYFEFHSSSKIKKDENSPSSFLALWRREKLICELSARVVSHCAAAYEIDMLTHINGLPMAVATSCKGKLACRLRRNPDERGRCTRAGKSRGKTFPRRKAGTRQTGGAVSHACVHHPFSRLVPSPLAQQAQSASLIQPSQSCVVTRTKVSEFSQFSPSPALVER